VELAAYTPAGLSWADKVAYLAAKFRTLEQTSAPVEHRFEPGVYIRTMRIPKDTLFLGRKHNHGHKVRLVEGECTLFHPGGTLYCNAPFEIESDPGFHSVVYTITDVVGETIHPNPDESRDVEALELRDFEPAQELFNRGQVLIEQERKLMEHTKP
jgi:hypothetical protein